MKIRRTERIGLVLIIMISMLLTAAVTVFADEQCSINVSPNLAGIEVTRGGREQVDLSDVFSDSLGHDLTYTLDESEESLKARIKNGVLLIDPLELGEFEIKITAKCEASGAEKQITIPVNIVESEDEGNPAQYGYDETPAESVTVTVTIASDGIPLRGNDADSTVLAHQKVTVPYFDLGLYGLEEFYRYHTKDGRGNYIDDEVVERPTAMHLMIYMTERYYMGIPEEECCQGTSGILDYSSPCTMYNMYGKKAYDASHKAYELTGNATSSYMQYLWGHDENLMYYRNHLFPLMSPGYGSTSDYQLLSDGNTFDLCMFTNWEFHYSGAFCKFDQEEYEAETGKAVGFSALYASSNWQQSGSFSPINGLQLEVYDEDWNQLGISESEGASFEFTFNKPGEYYVIGRDVNGGTRNANKAPATCVVHVKDSFVEFPFDKIEDDEGNALSYIDTFDDFPAFSLYHIKVPYGTENVNIFWNDLKDTELVQKSWDFKTMEIRDEEEAYTRDGDRLSTDPSKWELGENALVISDEDYNYYAAFTFEYYTPEHVNFAPVFKVGVKPENEVKLREQRTYSINMGDVFIDPDGDLLSYKVSTDEGELLPFDGAFSYYAAEPGRHTFLFYAYDDHGHESEPYKVTLVVTKNLPPEFKDRSNQKKEVSIRSDEKAKIDMKHLFSDPNGDEITYLVSRDGSEFETFEPVNENVWNYSTNEYDKQQNFIFSTDDPDERGTHTFRFRAADELGAVSDDIYDFIVTIADDKAPVPVDEESESECMQNHAWHYDLGSMFQDPEGDKMTYTVSVDGAEAVEATGSYVVTEPREYSFVFTAKDKYGETGSCTVNVNVLPEVLYELEQTDNTFPVNKDGILTYTVGGGKPDAVISGFDISRNVTLRGVRYSEYNGEYHYYLDVDSVGVQGGDTFKMSLLAEPSDSSYLWHPGFGDAYRQFVVMDAKNCEKSVLFTHFEYDPDKYAEITRHDSRWFVSVNIVENDSPEPVELMIEMPEEGLYVGEDTDRIIVKARYSDGLIRYAGEHEFSDERFDNAGNNVLTVSACGLTQNFDISVKEVPSYMAILNNKAKDGRVRLVTVTDENGDPVEDAVVTAGEQILNPDYTDLDYYPRYYRPDTNRLTTDIEVRLPVTSLKTDAVQLRFQAVKDNPYALEMMKGINVTTENQDDCIYGVLTVPLEGGKGNGVLKYYDVEDRVNSLLKPQPISNWSHAFDQFNVSVKTGACEIIGKVSSWDEKDNTEFLAYPVDMTDVEIRADAMGSRDKALVTSTAMEEAVKTDARYERSFKVEGLDAGNYKLAVIKPGKYVVPIVKADLDGTADVGSLSLRLYGDINNDGLLDVRDVTQIARFGVGKRQFTEEESLAADVNLDKTVDVRDITQLCRKIVGKSSSLDKIS